MATWATREDALALWPDAIAIAEPTLDFLLEVAEQQCAAYAPASVNPVPERYTQAVVLQAREVWSAARREGTADLVGYPSTEYAIRARPLVGPVKGLLRPSKGRPRFGGAAVTP